MVDGHVFWEEKGKKGCSLSLLFVAIVGIQVALEHFCNKCLATSKTSNNDKALEAVDGIQLS